MTTKISGSNYVPDVGELFKLPEEYKSFIQEGKPYQASWRVSSVYARIKASTKTAKKAQQHLFELDDQLAQSEGFFGKSFLRLTWIDDEGKELEFKRKTSLQLKVQHHCNEETFVAIKALIEIALEDTLNNLSQEEDAQEAKVKVERILNQLDQYCQELQGNGRAIDNMRIRRILSSVKEELKSDISKARTAEVPSDVAPAQTNKADLCLESVSDTDLPVSDLFLQRDPSLESITLNELAMKYLYATGGGTSDPKKAFDLLKKGADGGDPTSQCNLGVFYEEGIGIKQDYEEAVKWYKKSASQGNATAMYYLANTYELGIGQDINMEEAFKWYTCAAKAGYVRALCKIATFHEYALGGQKQDKEEAFKCYEKAANRGDSRAQSALGNYYYNNKALDQNDIKAVACYRKSAELGDPVGQYNLAMCYYRGIGVARDLIESYAYLKLAFRVRKNGIDKLCVQDRQKVQDSLNDLDKKMSNYQRKMAIGRAEILKNEIYRKTLASNAKVHSNSKVKKPYSTSVAGVFAVDEALKA